VLKSYLLIKIDFIYFFIFIYSVFSYPFAFLAAKWQTNGTDRLPRNAILLLVASKWALL
jgi:hypothetical protein